MIKNIGRSSVGVPSWSLIGDPEATLTSYGVDIIS